MKKFGLPAAVFLFSGFIMSMVQLKLTENPLLVGERYLSGAGWIEIFLFALYGAFIAYKMQDVKNVPQYRKVTWLLFTILFFGQMAIGLLGEEKFLMTGKLHMPIPMMIIAGPLYRAQLSVMTILFLSTVILSGPAWCSHLCYFGSLDNLAAQGKTKMKPLKLLRVIKPAILALVIAVALIFRWMNVPMLYAIILAAGFGIAGILIMIFISGKKKKMVHCTAYCPVGTVVNILKPVNPFRMYIDSNCDTCMKCTANCKYDALNLKNIKNRKPGFNCTLCGDCLSACPNNSIKYKFFNLNPETARKLYLFMTISIHAAFMALAKL